MITERQVVLLVRKSRLEVLKKFEALEEINCLSGVMDVWKRNKTPMIDKESLENVKYSDECILEIPEAMYEEKNFVEIFVDWCHKNGFECGEYKTGEIYDTRHDRCFMCEIAKHKGFTSLSKYNQFVDKPVDCIIYESENFYVLPELGSLKQGYVMIIPKEHFLSVAQFPTRLMPEYEEVCKDVEYILLNAFKGKMVCFMEHGSGPSGKTSHKKSIVHAHTHVVVDFFLKEKYKAMVQLVPCQDISQARYVHYFSYQEGTDGELMITMDPNVYVQRQFPRQVMAKELNFAPNQYNWRFYEFDEIAEATLFHLCEFLKTEKKGRIYERTVDFVTGFSARPKNKEE